MASLDTALAEIDKILAETYGASDFKTEMDRARVVVSVRSRVIAQLATLNEAIRTDARFQADPAAGKLFAERATALRKSLADLQAKWRTSDIVEKTAAYTAEAMPVAQQTKDFLTWARATRLAA